MPDLQHAGGLAALFGVAKPHDYQIEMVADQIDMINDPDRRSEVWQAPTGAGKTVIFLATARYCLQVNLRVTMLIFRTTLLDQLIRTVEQCGLPFGVVASTRPEHRAPGRPIQICMSQTLQARSKRTEGPLGEVTIEGLPESDVIIVDEAHQQAGGRSEEILGHYRRSGAKIIGVTATPVEIDHIYDRLRRGPSNRQLRRPHLDPPMHLGAHVYAGAEIDMTKSKLNNDGEFALADIRKNFSPRIYAEVIGEYLDLNPERKPAILFAPGVKESLWFVDRFAEAGISAAHIDGESVYVDGEEFKGQGRRQEIIERLRTGDINVVCNRFVMREGIDIPELYHLILACPIGSLMSYVQVVGRVLRYHKSLDVGDNPHVLIQDHGGNWWRHGSPNQDRPWEDWFHQPNRVISAMRMDAMADRDPQVPQPIACPKCGGIRASGKRCPFCGTVSAKGRRAVLSHDGKLTIRSGDPVPPRRIKHRPDTEKLWIECYHRAKRSGKTLSQARGLFVKENRYWPVSADGTLTLPYMPREAVDWYLPASSVPPSRLH